MMTISQFLADIDRHLDRLEEMVDRAERSIDEREWKRKAYRDFARIVEKHHAEMQDILRPWREAAKENKP